MSTTSSRSTTATGTRPATPCSARSAEALVANTKNFDVAARYGGDEFVVLLPGCGREDAMRVRAARAAARSHAQVGEAPVTVSAGVATMPDNASDAERLMAAADGALYEAKRTGRDRVARFRARGLELAAAWRAQLVGADRPRRLSSAGLVRPAAPIASARSSWWCALPAADRVQASRRTGTAAGLL